MRSATWQMEFVDNSGFRAHYKVKANSKPEAIKKGLEKAKKIARGDIISWNCRLITVLL